MAPELTMLIVLTLLAFKVLKVMPPATDRAPLTMAFCVTVNVLATVRDPLMVPLEATDNVPA